MAMEPDADARARLKNAQKRRMASPEFLPVMKNVKAMKMSNFGPIIAQLMLDVPDF